jgi:hypothetical protein
MKSLYALAYMAVLLLCAHTLQAQVTPPVNQNIADKPLLFSSLPQKLDCNLEEVDKLFMAEPSQKLLLQLNNHLRLEGVVAEKVQPSQEVLTINFKLSNFNGALFNISRIIQNGTIRYTGRIINKENGDVLTMIKENEKYYFTKQAQKFFMVE